MDNINFLFYDDINLKRRIDCDSLRVLRQNDDGTFSVTNFPYMMSSSIGEFQRQIGPIIYIIDENEDEDVKLIEECGYNKINHLERVTEIKFLFKDDMDLVDIKNNDSLKILVQNADGTFKTDNITLKKTEQVRESIYLIDGSVEWHGPTIRLIDKYKDSELIKKYGESKVRSVSVINNSYHVVAGYDKNNICVKGTDIVTPTNEPSLRFISIDKLDKKPNRKDIIILKQNFDDTISIVEKPIGDNCFPVVAVKENDLYSDDDIIQLVETGIEGKYEAIKTYIPKTPNLRKA